MFRKVEINNRGNQGMVFRQRMKKILIKSKSIIKNNLECKSSCFSFLQKVFLQDKEICNKQNNQPLYCITRKRMNEETKIINEFENIFNFKFDKLEQSNRQSIERNTVRIINSDNLSNISVKYSDKYQKLAKILIKKQPRYANPTSLSKIQNFKKVKNNITNDLTDIMSSRCLNTERIDFISKKYKMKSYQQESEFNRSNDRLKNDLLKFLVNTEDISNNFQINLRSFNSLPRNHVKKIGEATFSDVFCVKQKIYKIIPLKNEKSKMFDLSVNIIKSDNLTSTDVETSENHNSDVFANIYSEEENRQNTEEDDSLMSPKDFYRESYILKVLSKEKNVCQIFDSCILKDGYNKEYIEAWNDFKQFNTSENIFPLNFNKDQLFGCLIMEHGGSDLEKFIFKSKAEVKEVFFQTCYFLAEMEIKYEFEHRDLHWGNILITRLPKKKSKNKKVLINNYGDNSKNKYKIPHNKGLLISCNNQNNNIIKENQNQDNHFINNTPYKQDSGENKKFINSDESKEFNGNVINTSENKNIPKNKEDLKISNTKKFTSKFLEVKIIDFSLSRLKYNDTIIHKNLNEFDWLFGDETIIGEEHLKIYPKMKMNNQNDWKKFSPKNNVLWLDYLLFKLQEKGKKFRLLSFFQKAKKIVKLSRSARDIWKDISIIKTCIP